MLVPPGVLLVPRKQRHLLSFVEISNPSTSSHEGCAPEVQQLLELEPPGDTLKVFFWNNRRKKPYLQKNRSLRIGDGYLVFAVKVLGVI